MTLPASDLASLLAPVSTVEFLNRYRDQKSLILSESSGQRFTELFSPNDVKAWITCFGQRTFADYRFYRDGEPLPDLFAEKLMAKPDWFEDVLRNRWTVIIQGFHRRHQLLRRLCERLEESLNSPVWCNVYFTPAGGTGFEKHVDAHDVFIWQADGRKRWFVYEEGEKASFDGVLQKGHLLYLPEGVPHHAEACDGEHSLHFTIGFRSRSHLARRTLASTLAEWIRREDPGVSAELPAGIGRNISRDELRELLAGFGAWVEAGPTEIAPQEGKGTHFASSMNEVEIAESLVKLPRAKRIQLVRDIMVEGSQVRGGSTILPLVDTFAGALKKLAEGGDCALEELGLSPDLAASLARGLVANGLARITES